MTPRCCLLALAVVATLILPVRLFGQDTHYWTQQYGTRADLMGGVVVGSPLDLSASYYNPGSLALLRNPSTVLTAYAFELVDITTETPSGFGQQLGSLSFRPAPTLFAGSFEYEVLGSEKLVYSFLTRQESKFRLDAEVVTEVDLLPEPDDEAATAEVLFDQSMDEYWAGLTWSRPIQESIGAGVTLYGAYRGQRTRSQSFVQAVSDSGRGVTAMDIDEINYWHTRVLLKFGFAFEVEGIKAGVALTTPSLGLFGDGRSFVNRSVVGIQDSTGAEDSQLVADFQDGLKPSFKSPLSIAFGASYDVGATRIDVSAEWFNSVDPYEVLDPEPFVGQTTGEVVATQAIHAAKSVLNAGMGIEHTFNEHLSATASFITDFSSFDDRSTVSVSSWDLFHFMTGTTFTVGKSEFTLGIGYGTGTSVKEVSGLAGIPRSLRLGPPEIDVRYSRWKFLLGFSFLV